MIAQDLLGAPTPGPSSDDARAPDVYPTQCPFCHQGHWQVEILPPRARLPLPVGPDTS